MTILLMLIPISLLLLGAAVAAFIWAVRRGQFDDLDTPALDILEDDEQPSRSARAAVHAMPGGASDPAAQAHELRSDASPHSTSLQGMPGTSGTSSTSLSSPDERAGQPLSNEVPRDDSHPGDMPSASSLSNHAPDAAPPGAPPPGPR